MLREVDSLAVGTAVAIPGSPREQHLSRRARTREKAHAGVGIEQYRATVIHRAEVEPGLPVVERVLPVALALAADHGEAVAGEVARRRLAAPRLDARRQRGGANGRACLLNHEAERGRTAGRVGRRQVDAMAGVVRAAIPAVVGECRTA